MDLWKSSLLKYFLIWSSPTKSMSSLFHIFPLVFGSLCSSRLVLLVKNGKVSHLPHSATGLHFPTSLFCYLCTDRNPSCCLAFLNQIQFHLGLGLPNCISACSGSVSVLLPGCLSLLPPSVCSLFVLKFCQDHLVHPCKSLGIFNWLPAYWGGLLFSLEVVIIEYQ